MFVRQLFLKMSKLYQDVNALLYSGVYETKVLL